MALDYAGRQDEALAAYASAQDGGLWIPDAIERHADLLVRRGARDQAVALLGEDAKTLGVPQRKDGSAIKEAHLVCEPIGHDRNV